jgi:hypothetical protein
MIDRNRNSCSCREFRLFLEEIHQFLVCQEFRKGIPAGIPEISESGVYIDTLEIIKIAALALNPLFLQS